jgi:hypothetical protein
MVFVSRFLLYLNTSETCKQPTERRDSDTVVGQSLCRKAESFGNEGQESHSCIPLEGGAYPAWFGQIIMKQMGMECWQQPTDFYMPVHYLVTSYYRFVEHPFGVTNIRVFKPRAELALLFSIHRSIQTILVCANDGVRMLDICLTYHNF